MGDLDLHDPVPSTIRTRGPSHMLGGVAERLAEADLRLANLETVIVRKPRSMHPGRACLVAPLLVLDALLSANVDAVTFANNHVLDMGSPALLECLGHLRSAGLAVAGAGRDLEQAREPMTVRRNEVQFNILAYSYGCGQVAGVSRAGCAEARPDHILHDIDKVQELPGLSVVCLHMDAEFQPAPSPGRVALCRRLADAGVDIVLCHHPHVVQGVERWGRSLIAYSLGNYVTPVSEYMLAHSAECHLSFHAEVHCDAAGVTDVEVIPVVIDESGRPNLAAGSERENILELLADRSRTLSDADELRRLYRMMVANWSAQFTRLFYWSLRNGNWRTCRRLLQDLRQTPAKRRWIRDALHSLVWRNDRQQRPA